MFYAHLELKKNNFLGKWNISLNTLSSPNIFYFYIIGLILFKFPFHFLTYAGTPILNTMYKYSDR